MCVCSACECVERVGVWCVCVGVRALVCACASVQRLAESSIGPGMRWAGPPTHPPIRLLPTPFFMVTAHGHPHPPCACASAWWLHWRVPRGALAATVETAMKNRCEEMLSQVCKHLVLAATPNNLTRWKALRNRRAAQAPAGRE